MLDHLHRGDRDLDDFPGALDPAPDERRVAVRTLRHGVLHRFGRGQTRPAKPVRPFLPLWGGGLGSRRLGLIPGHPRPSAQRQPMFEGTDPLQEFGNGAFRLSECCLQLGNEPEQCRATGGGQLRICHVPRIRSIAFPCSHFSRPSISDRLPAIASFAVASLLC